MSRIKWSGFRFPIRQLTDEEIEIFSPICHKCPLPARVVEAQMPLDEEQSQQPLADFTNEELKLYCALHSPMDLPDSVFEGSILDFYARLAVEVMCPKYEHRRIGSNCIRMQPKCLRRCSPILQKIQDIPMQLAKDICDKGWEVHKAQIDAKQQKSKNGE